jgi:hypothetical protein
MTAVRAARQSTTAITLPVCADLSVESLRVALGMVKTKDWAEVLVHPSMLMATLRFATKFNATSGIRIRVGADSRLARDEWRLKVPGYEVRSGHTV